MTRLLTLIAMLLLFAAPNLAQSRDATTGTTTGGPTPVLKDGKLPAGKSVTDSKGRVIENGGSNENGSVKFRYTGKLERLANGNYKVSGEIPEVTNPQSQGSNGPININTDGEPTTINCERNGINPGGILQTNVTGGNATVNVSGNYNNTTVGGTGNTVNQTGNHNTGSGTAGSSGQCNQSSGNSWSSGGGNWTVTAT